MHLVEENKNVENKEEEKVLEQSSKKIGDDEILQLERLADVVLEYMIKNNSQKDE